MHKWTLASILTLRASSPAQHRTISVLIFTSLGQCDFSEENQTKAMDLSYNIHSKQGQEGWQGENKPPGLSALVVLFDTRKYLANKE